MGANLAQPQFRVMTTYPEHIRAGMVVRALFGVAMLWACTADELQAQRVVRETAAQWQRAKLLTLTPLTRWCVSGDDAGCDFRSIDDALVLPDGGLIASGAMGPIRHFAPDGALMKALGGRGKGPGEYGFVVHPQFIKDYLVWFDNTQMRSTSVTLAGVPGPVMLTMLPQTTENMYLVDGVLTVFDVPVSTTPADTVIGLYRTVPASGPPQVFARIRTPVLFSPGSDGMRPLNAPFAPRIVAGVSIRGDVAHSNGGQYLVDVVPLNGTPWRLHVDATKRAVTQKDRDSVEASMLKSFRVEQVASLPPGVRALFAIKHEWFPPLTAIFVLRDGTIWIRPRPLAGATSARWDVFSISGVRVGRAQLPIDARVHDGTRDWVLIVEKNADDVPTVVKYRVQ